MKDLILAVLFLAMTACPPAPPPIPPGPDGDAVSPVRDAVPADTGPAPVVDSGAPAPKPAVDACGAGEAKLLSLGCKDARGRLIGGPNLHDAGWAANCRIDAEAGVDLHAICIAAASDCAAVMACK